MDPVELYNEVLNACEVVNTPEPTTQTPIKISKPGDESHVDKPETITNPNRALRADNPLVRELIDIALGESHRIAKENSTQFTAEPLLEVA
jgi:hypothetical protein